MLRHLQFYKNRMIFVFEVRVNVWWTPDTAIKKEIKGNCLEIMYDK